MSASPASGFASSKPMTPCELLLARTDPYRSALLAVGIFCGPSEGWNKCHHHGVDDDEQRGRHEDHVALE